MLVKHKLCTGKGRLIKISHPERDKDTKLDEMYLETLKLLGDSSDAELFLKRIKQDKPRYVRDQFSVIKNAAAKASEDIIKQALKYCIERSLYSATLLKDTLLFMLDKSESLKKDKQVKDNPIPQKYKEVKTQIRDAKEYTQAMGG
ncbi:hypothetical protein EDD71_14610 [Fonticella tunisiensis]|uniref:Uncharacterized protein n=1 Tax=Fonticella tunisiensis TaxID=1096341 RepID=A0A4R7K6E9_9CLOT|nr:hypothetical protein EDD71_14610 [Fonticella tunisiensis]